VADQTRREVLKARCLVLDLYPRMFTREFYNLVRCRNCRRDGPLPNEAKNNGWHFHVNLGWQCQGCSFRDCILDTNLIGCRLCDGQLNIGAWFGNVRGRTQERFLDGTEGRLL